MSKHELLSNKDHKERIESLFHLVGNRPKEIRRMSDGRTNVTYEVTDVNYHKFVARLAGEGTNAYINRTDEVFNLRAVYDLGITPEIYSVIDGDILMEYIEGEIVKNEAVFLQQDVLHVFFESLHRLNYSNIKLNNEYRIIDNVNVYLNELEAMEVPIPTLFGEKYEKMRDLCNRIENIYNNNVAACHIDNYFGNLINGNNKMYFIDWEYSGMCDFYSELVNINLLNDINETGEIKVLDEYSRYMGFKIDLPKYYIYKAAFSFMWSIWHLIKLNQKYMVEYNEKRYLQRLNIADHLFSKYEKEIDW